MLNDILCTFCHHETVLELYGNGQGDQMILLAPSAGQNPVFIERIEADNLGKKCFFLFYSNKFRLRVRVFETCCLYINLSIEDNNYHNINEIHTFLTFSKHSIKALIINLSMASLDLFWLLELRRTATIGRLHSRACQHS